jgi:hypothetical protein
LRQCALVGQQLDRFAAKQEMFFQDDESTGQDPPAAMIEERERISRHRSRLRFGVLRAAFPRHSAAT